MSYYNLELLEFFEEFKKFRNAGEQLAKSSLKIAMFFAKPPIRLLQLMLNAPRLKRNLSPGKWEDVGSRSPGNYVSPFWPPPSSNDSL